MIRGQINGSAPAAIRAELQRVDLLCVPLVGLQVGFLAQIPNLRKKTIL